MRFLEAVNTKYAQIVYGEKPITSLEDIQLNEELCGVIFILRETLWMSPFNNEEEIDSFFRANMLLFNNLPTSYWIDSKKGGIINDDYYRIKLGITIDNKVSVINQLIQNWKDRKVINIEYSFRAMEVILGIKARSLNTSDLEENIIQLILKELEPFISRSEKKLSH